MYSGYPSSNTQYSPLPPPPGHSGEDSIGGPGYNAYYNSTIAPDQAWRQYNIDALNRDLGYNNERYNYNTGYLNRENEQNRYGLALSEHELGTRRAMNDWERGVLPHERNLAMQGFGLDRQDIATQRNYLQSANALGQQMFNIEQSGLQNTWAHDQEMQNFARQLFGVETESITRQSSFIDSMFGNMTKQMGIDQGQARRALNERQVASGSYLMTTPTTERGELQQSQELDYGSLRNQYLNERGELTEAAKKLGINFGASESEFGYRQANTQRDMQKLALQNMLRQAGFGRDMGMLGTEEGRIGLRQQGTGIDFARRESELNVQGNLFDVASRRLGIDRAQLENNFNKAMFDLGITNKEDQDRILREIVAQQAGGVEPYNSYAGTVGPYLYGGG